MLAFLRFEWRRIFCVKKNLISLGFIFLFSTYFVLSGVDEYRQFFSEKKIFLRYEKEKVSHVVNYSQYGGFGFRILFEAPPLNLFFINSNILQDVESNIDTFEMIEVESSFKGNKLFLKRGYFKDFAGIPLIFGSLFMLYLGHLALISSAYLRFIAVNISLLKYYIMTTISRLFWMDLFFIALSVGFFYLVGFWGIIFSRQEQSNYFLCLLFQILFLNFFYLLGQLITVLLRFRKIFFFWFFIVWFVCIFLLPEISRLSVFNQSQALESAEKVNLEKFRTLMALEKKFRDYLKENQSVPLDQIQKMQKKFAVQYINSTYLVNTGLESRYLRTVEKVIADHERQAILFPTTFYQFMTGEMSGKGYYGYLDFMDYIMQVRNRFIQFYLKKRYEENNAKVESFVKGDENVFHSHSRLPRTYWVGALATLLYGIIIFILTFRPLKRQVFLP